MLLIGIALVTVLALAYLFHDPNGLDLRAREMNAAMAVRDEGRRVRRRTLRRRYVQIPPPVTAR